MEGCRSSVACGNKVPVVSLLSLLFISLSHPGTDFAYDLYRQALADLSNRVDIEQVIKSIVIKGGALCFVDIQ